MAERLIPLFREAYPEIPSSPTRRWSAERFYATYSIGLFFDDKDCVCQPCDFRHVGLHRTAGYILGVDPDGDGRRASRSRTTAADRRALCLHRRAKHDAGASTGTTPAAGARSCAFSRDSGYRVICIDQKPVHGHGIVWNHIPHGAEDETGDRPLAERRALAEARRVLYRPVEGLAWLAWAVGTPVVMISGFTHPTNEFATPYRVINYHACNSCWNDPRHRFDHQDFLWCPRHADTPRQFECTRLITAEQVKQMIRQIPGFALSGSPSHATRTVGGNDMATITVSSGTTSSGLAIGSGSNLEVLFGGTVFDTIVNGGSETVAGSDERGALSDGGLQEVLSGGAADATTINSSGSQLVDHGGRISGTFVWNSGGHLSVLGSAVATVISSGGSESSYLAAWTSERTSRARRQSLLLSLAGLQSLIAAWSLRTPVACRWRRRYRVVACWSCRVAARRLARRWGAAASRTSAWAVLDF